MTEPTKPKTNPRPMLLSHEGVLFARPVSAHLARTLVTFHNVIRRLNEEGKSLNDASTASGIELNNLLNYIEALGITWKNKKTYKPRRKPTSAE